MEKVGKQLSVSSSVFFSTRSGFFHSLWGWTLWEPIFPSFLPVERSTFASCSADGSFKVWDIREKELAGKMARHIGGHHLPPPKRPYKGENLHYLWEKFSDFLGCIFFGGGPDTNGKGFPEVPEVELFLNLC